MNGRECTGKWVWPTEKKEKAFLFLDRCCWKGGSGCVRVWCGVSSAAAKCGGGRWVSRQSPPSCTPSLLGAMRLLWAEEK